MSSRSTKIAYKNIPEWTNPAPVGVDKVITEIQTALKTQLGTAPNAEWLTKSFGRAAKMSIEREDGDIYTFPSIFTGDGSDSVDILAMDNYDAFSFMVANDPESLEGIYIDQGQNQYTREIDLIFWMDLPQVNSSKVGDFVESLKVDIKNVLKGIRFSDDYMSIELGDTFDDPTEIFGAFSLEPEKTQNLHYPNRGIRFQIETNYLDGCI